MADISDKPALTLHEQTHDAFAQYIAPRPETPAAQGTKSADTVTPNQAQGMDLQVPPIDVKGWGDGSSGKGEDLKTGDDQGNGRPELSPSQEAILNAAQGGVGKELWRTSPFASHTDQGRLGAAASVSEVLKASGQGGIDSASISGLEQQMQSAGFEIKGLAQRKPGDVVVLEGPNGPNGSKRTGIVGENNTILQMNRGGLWMQRPFPPGAKGRVYSPPATCNE